jgi:protein TonB
LTPVFGESVFGLRSSLADCAKEDLMNVTTCAALLGASLLVSGPPLRLTGATAGARGPQTAAAEPQKPVADPVKGPKLGSSEIYQIGNGVQAPRLTKETKPDYPAQAKADRIPGMIRMDCVVLADGTVGDVKVTQSLDTDLDKEAVDTLRKWQFKPGTVDGKPVPVQVMVEMSFTLK